MAMLLILNRFLEGEVTFFEGHFGNQKLPKSSPVQSWINTVDNVFRKCPKYYTNTKYACLKNIQNRLKKKDRATWCRL